MVIGEWNTQLIFQGQLERAYMAFHEAHPTLAIPIAEVIEACQRSVSLHHLLDLLLWDLPLKARHVHQVPISLVDMLRGSLLCLLHRRCRCGRGALIFLPVKNDLTDFKPALRFEFASNAIGVRLA